MIIKIIWVLLVCDAFMLFALFYMAIEPKNDKVEEATMWVMAGAGAVVFLLALVPLLLSKSPISLLISGFFATLPMLSFMVLIVLNPNY